MMKKGTGRSRRAGRWPAILTIAGLLLVVAGSNEAAGQIKRGKRFDAA